MDVEQQVDRRRVHVLLVEDSETDAMIFRTTLRRSGTRAQVTVASSVGEAIDAIVVRRPDVIILDLVLPDADGLSGLAHLREGEDPVPVIVLTGMEDDDLSVDALRSGADDFLVKGATSPAQLARSIRFAIERDRMRRLARARDRERMLLAQLQAIGRTASSLHDFVRQAASALSVAVEGDDIIVTLYADDVTIDTGQDTRPALSPGMVSTRVPVTTSTGVSGELVVIGNDRPDDDVVRFLEDAVSTMSAVIDRRRAEASLDDRTRLLRASAEVARIIRSATDEENLTSAVADALVEAVRFPELASASVRLGTTTTTSGRSQPPATSIEESIRHVTQLVGSVQVGYAADQGWLDAERQFVRSVAEQLSIWAAMRRSDIDAFRLAQVLSMAPVGVIIATPEGAPSYVNPVALQMFGVRSQHELELELVLEGRASADDLLHEVTRPGGSRRTLRISSHRLRDLRGDDAGTVLLASDDEGESSLATELEELRETVEELRASTDLKDTFLRAVSHELRTDLAAIVGFAETLESRDDQLTSVQRQEMAGSVLRRGQHMTDVLASLLDLARMATGQPGAMVVERVDLADIARSVVAGIDMEGRTLTLSLDHVRASVDRGAVERIITNLLGNAVAHTPAGSTVLLSTTVLDGQAAVVIEDDGPGVAPEQRERIFQPFVRGPGGDTRRGTGIGLSLVMEFAEIHGGEAVVTDSALGGARFEVTLGGAG